MIACNIISLLTALPIDVQLVRVLLQIDDSLFLFIGYTEHTVCTVENTAQSTDHGLLFTVRYAYLYRTEHGK